MTRNQRHLLELLERRERADRAMRAMIEIGEIQTALEIDRRTAGFRSAFSTALEQQAEVPPDGPQESSSLDEGGGHSSVEGTDWLERSIGHLWAFFSSPTQRHDVIRQHWRKIVVIAILVALAASAKPVYESFFLANRGLTGTYFPNRDLGGEGLERRDLSIDFRWMGRPPIAGIPSEDFSVRWTGYVRAPQSGTYEFATFSDDGVRLWVRGQQIIDNWTVHGGTLDVGAIDLTEGLHPIRMEYFQATGDTVIRLSWRPPHTTRRVLLRPSFLYPERPEKAIE